jgi:hypothetical protein
MKHLQQCQKNISPIFLLISVYSFVSCITINKSEVPIWIGDINKVYPNEQYIAQRGYGYDQQSAQLSALGAISRYFSAHIETEIRETITVTDKISTSILRDESFIKSQANLFAVNYTEPWYSKDVDQWQVVAYINRSEAWSLYEQELRIKTNMFNAMYKEAEFTDESFKKVLFYSNADTLASKEKLFEKLSFANILYPPGSVFFGDTRIMLSEIPSKIENLKSMSSLYIECNIDYDNSIYTAISKIFSVQGFPITKEKGQAAYTCNVLIDENEQYLNAGFFYYPTININIIHKKDVIFSFNTSLSRIGASNEDVAKKRTYAAISNEIHKSFLLEIRKDFE